MQARHGSRHAYKHGPGLKGVEESRPCRGRHIQEDIPRMVEEAAQAHPGLSYSIAKPIGKSCMLCEAWKRHVAELSSRQNLVLTWDARL